MKTTLIILLTLSLALAFGYSTTPVLAGFDDESDLFEAGFVESCTQEALEALEQGAGIVLPEPVPVLLLTVAEAKTRRRAYADSLGDQVGLTAAMDSMADLMFADNMLGRYLPDEKVVYVIEDVLLRYSGGDPDLAAEKLFPVLAHELVHAYDHQVYDCVPAPEDLEELMADPSALPEMQTQMSLIEGRATYASELACLARGVTPLRAFSVEQAMNYEMISSDGTLAGDIAAGMGNTVLRLKMVQYAQGRIFAKQVHDFGGEKFFRHVFDGLPLSMVELEDFNVFLVRWAEEQEAALDGELQEDDTLDET
ncbi:MAG: hypothetical protein ACI9EF_001147 [Pseudohongiellaceae bacterium]|jgi:hypothetical protein